MSVLNKKLWRDLWQSKGQVLAVTAVIACGIAVYVAFLSSYRNLVLSRDSYYSAYRFHDFSIQMEKAPETAVFKIKELAGVRNARGRIVKDVPLTVTNQGENKIARLISLPLMSQGIIDGLHLVRGRLLQDSAGDECVVNDKFFEANQLKMGDRIQVTANGRRQSLKIVGTAQSPEYIYTIRNVQEMVPNPNKFGIIWVQQEWAESQLNLRGAINEIVGEVYDSEQLNTLLDQAKELLKPYGIYARVKRENQLSHWYLKSEIDGLAVSATITPAIFLLMAALILVILLSRMVRREQTQIGLLKAYGYSNTQISMHYVKFASILGIIGGLIGEGVGQWMGRGMIQLYIQFYTIPILRYQFYPDLLGNAILISTGCALFSALLVVRSVVNISPATAMRDSPPRTAHKTLLEKIPALWNHVSFTNKIILRNIGRYPMRSGFTVLGVMLSTSIVMMGYFSGDAMNYMLEHQFEKVQREDVRVTFYREQGQNAWLEALRWPGVRRAEPLLMYPFEIKTAWKKKELLITGLPAQGRLFYLLDEDNHHVQLKTRGLTLMKINADELKLRAGDKVTIKPLIRLEKEHEVVIEQVVQQYVGAGAYMRHDALSRLLGESLAINALLLKLDGPLAVLNAYLKEIPLVASVEVKQDALDNFNKTIGESMGISMFFLTLFAGVIAIAVIYNSTAINITERSREMASLRVLGYTTAEVGRIIFNENLFLSLLGLAIGLPFGHLMCKSMTAAYTTEVFRFPFYISSQTYWISGLTILGYVVITNVLSRKRIATLDMVEALKSRE